MSGDTIAVLGVGATLLAAILTFGFALLGAHRATQAILTPRMGRMDHRMDRMDGRMDRMEATLNDLRRDVTDIDRRLSRIEGAVLGPWRPEPPSAEPPSAEPPSAAPPSAAPPPAREARQEPAPVSGATSPRP